MNDPSQVTNEQRASPDSKGLVFLVGLMGSGKTYWSQRIANILTCDWIDLDQQIEKVTDMKVKEIFATEGEDFFRAKERDTLRQLSAVGNLVVACGGGTPCFHENMTWMNANGTTIWLEPGVEETVTRLKRGKYKRPLIADLDDGELEAFVISKLEERAPFYSRAHYHVKGEQINTETFLQLLKHA